MSINVLGGVLQSIGIILAFVGIILHGLNNRSSATGPILAAALIVLAAGRLI